jgi:hypothetical protein
MRKFALLFGAAILLSGCHGVTREAAADTPYAVPVGSVVLRVEVLKVEFTDWYPSCPEEECIPWSYWHKYQARVKEVISGEWRETEVHFMHLQHALYVDEVTRDCYVVLHPAGPDLREKVGVPYIANRIFSPFFKGDRATIKALREGA